MSAGYSTFVLPNGVTLAYEILGASHLGRSRPIVLVSGVATVRRDWDRLSRCLAQERPVLIYDHRGIGDSVCPATEEISIETMARDLLALLTHLQWKEIAICGWSMGGVVTQQLLVLPHHPTNPDHLPFRVTHVFLAGTRSEVIRTGFPVQSPVRPRNGEERRMIVEKGMARSFDPEWVGSNRLRFEALVDLWISGSPRPLAVIERQNRSVMDFDIRHLLDFIPRDIKILIIHGELDQIIPFSAGQNIKVHIPFAKFMPIGVAPGQVPSTKFGHFWFEYFDERVWRDLVEVHLRS